MKIFYVCHITNLSGASKALLNLVQVVSKDNDVYILLPENKGWLVDELRKIDVKLYFVNYGLMWYPRKLKIFFRLHTIKGMWYSLKNMKSAKRYIYNLLQEIQPDIVHCNCGPLDISLDACLKLSIPHVWHLREYQDKDFNCSMFYGKRHFVKRLHTKGNFNIAITNGVFEHFSLRPCDRVIYDGPIDVNKIVNCSKKDKIVLFVGNFLKAKKPDVAIRAFLKFHNVATNYKMYIVGAFLDVNYYNECCKLVEVNAAQSFVKFLGRRDDVYELMAQSEMLIVPSIFEGFGFITAEGMANGCVVLGRNTAGTKEQFDVGLKMTGREIGFRFTTEADLVQCMEKVSKTDCSGMLKAAKNVVLSNYTQGIHAQKVMDYYKKILKTV